METETTKGLVKDQKAGSADGRARAAGRGGFLATARRVLGNKWTLRLLVYGGIVLALQITAMVQGPFFLPTVPSVLAAIPELFTEGHVWTLGPTLQQLVVGFAIAMAIAIPAGALMGRFKFAEDFLAPWVNTLFVTSKESLLPVIILVFGLGFGYRVTVVVLFALFFPVINTAAGIRYVEKELKETARAFDTGPWRMLTRVYVPAAAPFVVAGIRLGLAMALKGMVIAEIWVSIGTGHLLGSFVLSPRRLDLYYALATLIIAIAVGMNELLKVVERRLRPYAQIAGTV